MKTTQNKGFKMALPFIAGAALGALAVVAFNKRDKLAQCAKDSFAKGKELASDGLNEGKALLQKGKEFASELTSEPKKRTRRTPAQMQEATQTASKKTIKRAPRKKLEPTIEPQAAQNA